MKNKDIFAVVFPGQGSQSLHMLADFAADNPLIEATFAEVSSVVGRNLWQVVQQGPQNVLDATVNTQPIMLAADVALWRVWEATTGALAPTYLAGHSLGEYSALVCAQALSLADAASLVQQRAQLMQNANAPGVGAMAAIIGLEPNTLETLCQQAQTEHETVTPANYNSLGQCVVAGHTAAVDRLIELAKQHAAKIAKKIPVSVASHCELMRPAVEPFAEALAKCTMNLPHIPVVQNTDVKVHSQVADIKQALLQQLTSTVRWVETIQYFRQQGVTSLIECGPGQVLAKLNKRIDKTMQTYTLATPVELEKLTSELQAQ